MSENGDVTSFDKRIQYILIKANYLSSNSINTLYSDAILISLNGYYFCKVRNIFFSAGCQKNETSFFWDIY